MRHVIHGDPLAERTVTQQLDAWAAALDAAVRTLSGLADEVRSLQQKGEPADVGDEGAAAHGGGAGDQ